MNSHAAESQSIESGQPGPVAAEEESDSQGRRLRLLLLVDSQELLERIIAALRRGGLDPEWERVGTADALRAALANGPWDAVVSDPTLANFGAEAALEVARSRDADLTVFVIWGAAGVTAAAATRAGATDCVPIHDLAELAPAVEREVRGVRSRRAKRGEERRATYLAAVVDSSDEAIISKTLDGIITTWNLAAEQLYGWAAAEAIGRHISFLIPPDKIGEMVAHMNLLRAGRSVGYVETVRVNRSGELIDVSLVISRVRDATGRLVGVSKTARDIRARKRAEVALRESEARYRGLMESIPTLVWVYDAAGRALLHNRRWYEYTGQTVEDADAGLWHQAVHPDDAAAALAQWTRCVATGEPYSAEYRLRRADGAYRWFLSQGTPWRVSGTIDRWVGTSTDVDDMKRAAERLASSESRYRRLFEASQDGILIIDPASRKVVQANPCVCELIGYGRDELIGKELWEIGRPEDAAANRATIEALREEGCVRYDDRPLVARGGRRIDVEVVSNVYEGGDGRVIQCNVRDITGRRQAENKLRLFRALIDGTTDAIEVVDPETGRFLDVNEAACAAHGYTREEYLSLRVPDVDANAGPGPWRSLVERRGLAEARTIKSRHRRKDGTTFPVEINLNPIRLDRDYLVAVVRDITERERAEAALRVSEERFRAFMDHSPAAKFIKDEGGRYLYVNATWLRQFDPEPTAWEGKTDYDFWPRATADLFRASDRTCYASGTVVQIEETGLTPGGSEATWQVMKFPLAEGGCLVGGMAWDITDRKRAEEALRLRDRAIQVATQGLVITDPSQPDNPIAYVSPGFERMTGYAAAEAVGRNCRFLQGKGSDRATVRRLKEAVEAAEPVTAELLNYRKDGTTFWNELSIAPVRDRAGVLTHFVGVLSNVTARRELQEQFRQAQKMEAFGQLAGGVAHDFNNLLTVINGYSDILLEDLPAGDPSRELIAEIHKAGERSAGLTRQLLAFSRQQVLAPRVLSLNEVITDTGTMLRRLIGEDIRLATVLAPGLWQVRADPGQVEQVLMNLVVNARDAMPTGGKLTIETRNVELDDGYCGTHPESRPGRHVLLSVTDAGGGMPPEVAARVFEPFYTTKEQGRGTGLGLATVHGIVRQSGGHVAVYSEVGVGTTFKVYLPEAELEPAGGSSTRPVTPDAPPGEETVLLVEDEASVRALARRVLAGCGYTVIEAADGNEAVRVAAEGGRPIDVLITDVVMPGMGGRAVAKRVAASHPRVRVLFVSGYTDDAVIRHGVLTEGVNYLQKPFTPSALAHKVREVLDGRPLTLGD